MTSDLPEVEVGLPTEPAAVQPVATEGMESPPAEPAVCAAPPAPEAAAVAAPEASVTPTAPAESAPMPVESAPVESALVESATVESAPEGESRSRPRLNPTVNPDQAKAIPTPVSFAGAGPAEPPPDAAAIEAAEEAQRGPMAPTHKAEAVSLPAKNYAIDAEMEAEIAAALASGEIPGAIADPTAAPAATRKTGDIPSEDELEPGARLKGKVQSTLGENVILDLGYRASGCIPARQFEGKLPEAGATLDVVVDKYDQGEGLIFCSLPKATRSVSNWSEVAVGQIVDCMVVKSNKGGLEVSVNNLRGFLPAGQVDIGYVASLDPFVGQKLRVKITEVNPQKKNLVVSRRAFLEIARGEAREELLKTLAVGQTHQGTVKTLKDYGAFVDIGGVDGLLHVGEMSWSRINHPSDVLKEGQQVEVQILSIDKDKSKISLGMRQLQQDPWRDIEAHYPANTVIQGKVTKTTDFGAFVELEPGIEGLIHISELEHRRVHRVTDVVKVGQEVSAQVLSIDLGRKRIALSLKSMLAKPQSEQKKEDVDLAPGGGAAYERKRKGPLKGGTAGGGGGGNFLFGS